MVVIPGPGSRELGEKIASLMNLTCSHPIYRVFPDGESYVRLSAPVAGKDVVIVQTTYPNQDKRLLELLFLVKTAKDLEARRVTAVVPYLAYARQDRRFAEGECVSIHVVLDMIRTAGADKLLTVDIHKVDVLKKISIPWVNISAAGELAKHLESRAVRPSLILAPDAGARDLARKIAEPLGIEHHFLKKIRNRETGSVRTLDEGIPRAEVVAIADDIISTGSSIANAASVLRKRGVRRIYAYCVHPVLVGGALVKLKDAGVEEVVGTDSVPSEISAITVAGVLAEAVAQFGKGSSS